MQQVGYLILPVPEREGVREPVEPDDVDARAAARCINLLCAVLLDCDVSGRAREKERIRRGVPC